MSAARVTVLEVEGLGCVFVSGHCFPHTLHYFLRASTGRSCVSVQHGQTQSSSPSAPPSPRPPSDRCKGGGQAFPRLTPQTSDSTSPPARHMVVLQNLLSLLISLPCLSSRPPSLTYGRPYPSPGRSPATSRKMWHVQPQAPPLSALISALWLVPQVWSPFMSLGLGAQSLGVFVCTCDVCVECSHSTW